MELRYVLILALQIYSWVIVARVVLSWVNPFPRNHFLQQIIRVTEPVLAPLRGLIPTGRIDLSPLLALLLIQLLMRFIR